MSRIRNFGLASIVLKLSKFPLFNNFFHDIVDFWDLDNFLPFKFLDLDKFWLFNFFNFLAIFSLPLIPNLLTSSLPTPNHLRIDLFNSTIVFNIKISRAVIIVKL